MNTLEQLKSRSLMGAKQLAIAQDLTEFPVEVFDLADSLEVLDLSGNRLCQLPDNLGQLQQLKILFLSFNQFEELPSVLADCPQLSMIGFKANRIRTVPENALPEQTRWLILTDNQIEQLPASMGQLTQLQKLMLAGNRLTSLPPQMAACRSLELVRLAANQLEVLPKWLMQLPRLSWLAYSGNPCCPRPPVEPLREIDWRSLQLQGLLGEGASGIISKAIWTTEDESKPVAVKQFKGEVTSDGLPLDEMQTCIAAGQHPNLVSVLGKMVNGPQEALVLSLIPPDYGNLGNPPNFETCTRDTFRPEATLAIAPLLNIAQGIAAVAVHLHQRGILHGDLYAHNILVNPAGQALLGDFGAASRYQPEQSAALEAIEVRAFGCLLDDLLGLWDGEKGRQAIDIVRELRDRCLQTTPQLRPSFPFIDKALRSAQSDLG